MAGTRTGLRRNARKQRVTFYVDAAAQLLDEAVNALHALVRVPPKR